MFLVSAVKTSFLNLIYHGAGTVNHLLQLKFSMPKHILLVNLSHTRVSEGKNIGKTQPTLAQWLGGDDKSEAIFYRSTFLFYCINFFCSWFNSSCSSGTLEGEILSSTCEGLDAIRNP